MAVSRSRCSRQIGVGPAAHSSNYISTKLWNQTSSKGIASGDSAALMWDPQLMIAATKPYWVITHTNIYALSTKVKTAFVLENLLNPALVVTSTFLGNLLYSVLYSVVLSASDDSENIL